MINYDSKNWVGAIRHFNTSYVIRRTMTMCLKMGLFTATVAGLDYLFNQHPDFIPLNLDVIVIEPAVFSLLGVFLSLLLVFRTNSAYDRWWEGRKQWGALINHTRGLAVLWHGMLRDSDHTNRRFFAKGISAYVLSLSAHHCLRPSHQRS
ncbi:MAG: bestrophin family ion channel, partial [Bacteroidota bacterium]